MDGPTCCLDDIIKNTYTTHKNQLDRVRTFNFPIFIQYNHENLLERNQSKEHASLTIVIYMVHATNKRNMHLREACNNKQNHIDIAQYFEDR